MNDSNADLPPLPPLPPLPSQSPLSDKSAESGGSPLSAQPPSAQQHAPQYQSAWYGAAAPESSFPGAHPSSLSGPASIKRGTGSTRAVHPEEPEATDTVRVTPGHPTEPNRQSSRTPWGAILATAAITALVVSGAMALVDRVLPADHEEMSTNAPVSDAGSYSGEWTGVADATKDSVVSIRSQGGGGVAQGSGVLWDKDGHVVTNNHVVANAAEGNDGQVLILVGNRGYQAKILGTDVATDLAVLKLQSVPEGLTPIKRGDSDKLRVGDDVMAIGSPLGLDGSYTTGIVSALNRPVSTGEERGNSVVTNAIQTSAPLNPGNSGGALVNRAGELVGINSSIATVTKAQAGSIGIGFAIPGSLVENVVSQIIDSGKVEHAWIGITTTDGQADAGNGVMLGAQVMEVADDGPSKGKLEKDDLIVDIDGKEVTNATHLVGTIRSYRVGDEVKVSIIRNGKPEELTVTLGSSPTLNG